MGGRLLKVAYGLRYHYLGGRPLERSLVNLAVLAAAVLIAWSRLRLVSPYGLAAALLLLAAAGFVAFQHAAARRSFLEFIAEPGATPPAPEPLAPEHSLRLHATGQFEVEGKSHFFAGLLAYWQTFATREHAVMAAVPRSRFLLLARIPPEDAGMWYIFFQPEMVHTITPGLVVCGADRHPALHIRWGRSSDPIRGPRRAPFPGRSGTAANVHDLYLVFESRPMREVVWADLLADQ